MGTLRSIYVGFSDGQDFARIQDRLKPGARIATEPGRRFAEVPWGDFEVPAQLLELLSRECHTNVLWLAFQSVVDAFAFEHWQDGKCNRRLVFGCFTKERTWERIVGVPEPWENGVFDPPLLGAFNGSFNGRETARAVAEFYDLPGWS